ncbi:MAG: hypothetical protein Q9187_004430 [Circinaria calcarea]
MSRLLTPNAVWRGLTHKQLAGQIQVATLKEIVERGGDPDGERPNTNAVKQTWMLAAMRVIDSQVPRPDDGQALTIWRGDTSSLKKPTKQTSRAQAPRPLGPPTQGSRPRQPVRAQPLGPNPPPPPPFVQRIPDAAVRNALILRSNIVDMENLTLGSAYDDRTDPDIASLRISFYSSLKGPKMFDPVKTPCGRVLTQSYSLNRTGKSYPLRGRGAVWDSNSCAFDCVLAASRLLGVGSATVDYENQSRQEWVNTLQPQQQSFIAAVDYNWDLATYTTSIRRRHDFLKIQLAPYNTATKENHTIGKFLSAVILWKTCTSMTTQFTVSTRNKRGCTECNLQMPDPLPAVKTTSNGIDIRATMENAENQASMRELLQRHFAAVPARKVDHNSSCQDNAIVKYLEVDGDLPSHLVIYTNPNYKNVKGATSDDITFQYYSDCTDEQPGVTQVKEGLRRATYRWVGGIYLQDEKNHYRLYWTDDSPNPRGNIKIYDGQRAMGAIIGGVPPDHPVDKIVDYWADGAAVLFYERVEPRRTKRKADGDGGPVPPQTPLNKGDHPVKKPRFTGVGPTPPETPQNKGSKIDIVDLT